MYRKLLGVSLLLGLCLSWGELWGMCNNNSNNRTFISGIVNGSSSTGPFCIGDRLTISGTGFDPATITSTTIVEIDPPGGNNTVTVVMANLAISQAGDEIQFDVPALSFGGNGNPPFSVKIRVITGSNNGDEACVTVTFNPNLTSSFLYQDTICQTQATISPSNVVPQNGTFSVSGVANNAFNAQTGDLFLSNFPALVSGPASIYNSYTIIYTPMGACPVESSQEIVLVDAAQPDWSFNPRAYCLSGSSSPTPIDLDNTGRPFANVFNPFLSSISTLIGNGTAQFDRLNLGTISLTNSDPGKYRVDFVTNDLNCPETISREITLYGDDPLFFYVGGPYCPGDPVPTPWALDPFATFSSNTAVLLDTLGTIDLQNTPAGQHVISISLPGCGITSSSTITIQDTGSANFAYAKNTFCLDEANPLPTQFPLDPSGIFSSPDPALIIDPQTGEILLDDMVISSNISGTQTLRIDYSASGNLFCSDTHTELITIIPNDTNGFSNLPDTLCYGTTGSFTVATLDSQGYFFSTPSGLDIDSMSGVIQIDSSAPNRYTVFFQTTDTCPELISSFVDIRRAGVPDFTYPDSMCQSGPDSLFPFYGAGATMGGAFFCQDPLLGLDTISGGIDVAGSPPGTYTVKYTTPTPCPESMNATVVIIAPDQNDFTPSEFVLCKDVNGTLDINLTVNDTGSFSSFPSGLILDPQTGVVDIQVSTPGSYQVVFMGSYDCPLPVDTVLTIGLRDTADFAYPDSFGCKNLDSSLIPMYNPGFSFGGSFTPDFLLAVEPNTGVINLTQSGVGTNDTIWYHSNGVCPDSHFVLVDILDPSPHGFDLNSQNLKVCGDTIPIHLQSTQNGSGTFYSTPVGLHLGVSTGQIAVDSSEARLYSVTFTSSDNCQVPDTTTFEVIQRDSALFFYDDSVACTIGTPFIYPTLDSNATAFGFFSSDSLQIDSITGKITIGSVFGSNFEVSYRTRGVCPDTRSVFIDIETPPSGDFYFPQDGYCSLGDSLEPIKNNLANGFFSSFLDSNGTVNPRLVFHDSLSGIIDLQNSKPGEYVISYTSSASSSGSCVSTLADTITILPVDGSVSIYYPVSRLCINGSDMAPMIVDPDTNTGRFRFAPQGLEFQFSNGRIDVDKSQPGLYAVSYQSLKTCTLIDTVQVEILDIDDSDFGYRGDSTRFCLNGSNPVPLDSVSGIYYCNDTNLVFVDSLPGVIDLSRSEIGIYDITHITQGDCPDEKTKGIALLGFPEPRIDSNETAREFCLGETFSATVLSGDVNIDKFKYYLDGVQLTDISSSSVIIPDSLYPNEVVGIHTLRFCGINNGTKCKGCGEFKYRINPTPTVQSEEVDQDSLSPGINLIRKSGQLDFEVYSDYDSTFVFTDTDSTFNVINAVPRDTSFAKEANSKILINPKVIPEYENSASELRIKIWGEIGNCLGDTITYYVVQLGDDESPSNLFFPQVITPNGDGFNDNWEIRWDFSDAAASSDPDSDISRYTIVIYNDYGGEIQTFEGLESATLYDFSSIPNGVYWFIVKNSKMEFVAKGGLTVLTSLGSGAESK